MKPYKLAKIYKGKQWFVYYSYADPQTEKFQRFIWKKGINRIKDLRERLTEAIKIRDAINEGLVSGDLNPYPDEETGHKHMRLIEAIDWAFETIKPRYAESSVVARQGLIKHLKESIIKTGMDISISMIRKVHVKKILEYARQSRSLSNTHLNAHAAALSVLFSEMEEWEMIEYHPMRKMKKPANEQATKYVPLTPEEIIIIAAHLKKAAFPLYVFTKTIFRTGIRPDEILELKYGDVTDTYMELRPSNPNGKKKVRMVAIDPELKLDYDRLLAIPGDYYFSEFLHPGTKRIDRNEVSRMWRWIVKDYLGIDKHMYALKASGADARLKAGNSIEDVQRSFGHSSPAMTRIYDKHNAEKKMIDNRLRSIVPDYG